MPALRFLLLLLLWRPVAGQPPPPDTVARRLQRLGYFLVSASKNGPPFTAYKLNAAGSISVYPTMPVYYLDGAGRPLPGGPYQYGSGDFQNGQAIVHRDDREGVINQQGTVVIALRYASLRRIRHPQRWLAARAQQGWGLIDSVGQEIIPPRYEDLDRYSEGRLAARREGKWGFLDLAGREVIPPLYQAVHREFRNGFVLVQQPGLAVLTGYGFINRHGQAITPFAYEIPFCAIGHFRSLTSFYQFNRGFAIVGDDACRKGVVDSTGRLVLPIRFSHITRTDSTLVGHYRRNKTVVYRIPR
ncbi:WG repeat-containing protein [Hymenobacter edaphi]|uniref:WG repeat-containing protein n=1 Tax=Hymenobacter edaphi TaxID=2211146 RepID=A0A328BDU8_9BACT|nr:WG repeat-containing protein [Hymenobacter edaphi]RAK65117.1 hypothetical protein DLM85_16375 [Hymenobacter edaphi]